MSITIKHTFIANNLTHSAPLINFNIHKIYLRKSSRSSLCVLCIPNPTEEQQIVAAMEIENISQMLQNSRTFAKNDAIIIEPRYTVSKISLEKIGTIENVFPTKCWEKLFIFFHEVKNNVNSFISRI